MSERLEKVSLLNGDVVSFSDIWTVHPMPVNGMSDEELSSVDISEGEQRFGPNGETLRILIDETLKYMDLFHGRPYRFGQRIAVVVENVQ